MDSGRALGLLGYIAFEKLCSWLIEVDYIAEERPPAVTELLDELVVLGKIAAFVEAHLLPVAE